ncbi:metallophosphoesterase [Luedemannella flava]
MTKIAIIGDVGGCADQLAAAIRPLVDDEDTIVIQVGDLVDRGPDSAGVLALVRERLDNAPHRWVQLIGNHEAQYLGGTAFWPHQLDPDDADLLHGWWLKERLRVAAAVRTADGEEFLVTHAGLTVEAWQDLGAPVTAGTAADLLNTRPDDLLWHFRGPLWAEAGPHVYQSWLQPDRPVPFGQIHGHSTIVNYRHGTWLCDERVRQRTTVAWAARHTFTRMGGSRFIAVDPKHGTTGAPTWSPSSSTTPPC